MGEAANRRWDIKHGGLLRVAVLLLDLWVWRRVMGRETFEEWLISGGGGGVGGAPPLHGKREESTVGTVI